jgi:carboxylesterase
MTRVSNWQPYSGSEHQPFEFGDGPRGALLIHGFPGTPAEVRGIGQALAEQGWRARGPLLPGFGPDIVNLAERQRADWLRAVEAEWEVLHAEHQVCALIGFSMGGALALHLAERRPPDKLVLIAPFWRLPGFLPRLVPVLKLVMPAMRPFKDADFNDLNVRAGFERLMPDVDLDDPEVQTYLRQEVTLPLSVIDEVFRLGRDAYRLARNISVPTLVIQGRDDQMVRPPFTRKLVGRLESHLVTYREIPGGHELIHDNSEQKAVVTDLIIEFLDEQPLS